ncbi:DUF2285 domain-containing protein [Phyllobacterium phragmitis]|uniref:DUF2285 domain-containing protein n=1 Tax=Phyllobacterium phragmitis TaxID=2670329 RepID=UPI003CC9BA5C
MVRAVPDGFGGLPLPDPQTLPADGRLARDGLHTLVADDDGDHRLWFPDGNEPTKSAIVLPIDEHFFWRHRNAGRFVRRLEGKRPGILPRAQRLTAFQIHRAALMLRAWDGMEAGASRRMIASVLLNRKIETLRAIEWQNAPERRRLARILKAARGHIEGGYLRWLRTRR